jgi:hypothetical protein
MYTLLYYTGVVIQKRNLKLRAMVDGEEIGGYTWVDQNES